jgi:uncharacterized protein DUF4118
MKPEKEKDETRVWVVVGALGSVIIAALLIPLRNFTSASNLAFIFLAFTIIVAEVGGRPAALMTALVSAMSLNFFLTEPYLTLRITKPEDLIACIALFICGLIAAAFGKERRRWSQTAVRAEEKLDILSNLVEKFRRNAPLEEILRDLQQSFELGAIVLRDENERILAAAPTGLTPLVPETQLHPATLFPSQEKRHWLGAEGFRLPKGGGRLSLKTDRASISIDLWEGAPEGLSLDKGRTLAIAALILVLELPYRQK